MNCVFHLVLSIALTWWKIHNLCLLKARVWQNRMIYASVITPTFNAKNNVACTVKALWYVQKLILSCLHNSQHKPMLLFL
ncbi:Uncharacterised protein [Mycobacteroides abscessus subsp. abscessus]|nr:Uncharacterised protein [Mycobacteroides abscessus subsp. abscessus]